MRSYERIVKLAYDAKTREELMEKWDRASDQLGVYLNWLRLIKDIRQIRDEAEKWLVEATNTEKERNRMLEEFLLQGTELPIINDKEEQLPETD